MQELTAHPQPPTGYVVDAENVAEMARLIRQAGMLSEHLGILPISTEPVPAARILDIACGPGEWALEMAGRFSDSRMTCVDISEGMIAYARYRADAQNLSTVEVVVLDVRRPLPLPAASFDLVHRRFFSGSRS